MPLQTWFVFFDKSLVDGVVSIANWAVMDPLGLITVTAVRVFNRTVRIRGTGPGPLTPPIGVTYTAATPDLIGLNGLPVAPFADLPFS